MARAFLVNLLCFAPASSLTTFIEVCWSPLFCAGDVEQAFYRFRRTDCSPASLVTPQSNEGAERRALLVPHLAEATPGAGSAGAAPSTSSRGSPTSTISTPGGGGGGGGSWSSSSCHAGDKGGLPQPPMRGQGGRAWAGHGQPEPPPILLIPGLGAAMATWGTALVRELSCYREVILLENRGSGLSVDYAPGPLTYYSMAGGLVAAANCPAEVLCCLSSSGAPQVLLFPCYTHA